MESNETNNNYNDLTQEELAEMEEYLAELDEGYFGGDDLPLPQND